MTTTDNPSPQTEQAKPSFFCTIASRESHPLLSREELVRIIKHDAMVAARTDDFRKRKAISAELAREAKLMMPGITASALMDGKGKELCNLVRPTYVMAVDIDHIPSPMMEETKRRADEDPHTMMRYVTASGQGLRILCRYTPLDDEDVTVAELFDVMVRKAMGHYSRLLGVPADEQCHDITRMCGLAHDPTLFCRWDSVAFGMDAKDLKALYAKKANQEKYAKRAARRKTPTRKASRKQDSAAIPTMQEAAPHIEGLMERWGYRFESGRHNEYVLHYAKVCVRYGIPREEVMQHCATQFGPYYPDYASVVKACYRKLQLLGTWEFHREGERTPSKATAKAIKQWLGMRYEFHRNVVTGAYELRSRDVARGLFPAGRASTTTSRTPSGASWTRRASSWRRRSSTPSSTATSASHGIPSTNISGACPGGTARGTTSRSWPTASR